MTIEARTTFFGITTRVQELSPGTQITMDDGKNDIKVILEVNTPDSVTIWTDPVDNFKGRSEQMGIRDELSEDIIQNTLRQPNTLEKDAIDFEYKEAKFGKRTHIYWTSSSTS